MPGRPFGISSSFANGESKLGAVTLTEARLCFTAWPKSIDVLSGHPNVILQVTRGLAELAFRAENWLGRFGTRSPRARLAHLLIELADDFADAGRGKRPGSISSHLGVPGQPLGTSVVRSRCIRPTGR